ncbi:MAG: serine protease, partial [Solobacterium sp.]|nr:serine protease [Solobacterium sp.]
MMKKLMPVALALLLVWNLVLTMMLIRNLQKNNTGNSSLEDMNSTNYTTSDYTNAIEKSRSSVVTVESDGSYYSGIIIAKEKETVHILTTAKAIKNGSPNVVFDSGVRVSSTVVGDDFESGIALIQVTINFEVKPFTILDTTALAQGANVVVMSGRNLTTGSAVVSSGIVSEPGVWRMNGTTTWLSSMLEMDTPITSIQEGGAVIDLNGSLVGVVASQPFQGNSRMEYAITANEIKLIYNALKTNGKVTRGALGVVMRNISSMLAYEK